MSIQFMNDLKYYSQFKQDWFLDNKVFGKKEGGVFVDIGANDGITLSNTYFFEKNRGWTGVCIEPLPDAFKKLEQNRNCILVNACISPDEGYKDFLSITGHAEMLSGLIEKYDQRHMERIDAEINYHGGSKDIIKVPCLSLKSLLLANNIENIDYCSIDTEGGEYEILESIEFKEIEIKAFTVENNYENEKIKKLLSSNGYKMVKREKCDEFYVKRKKRFFFF